ncbi:MAG: hypothetical protein M3552_00630 [Planctomycetota bacterium]|nr:hypothetical protein [Planctomycetaceae bacterium]MDQ3329150.1 hypothetical protein [Planctomycetota bacterium]
MARQRQTQLDPAIYRVRLDSLRIFEISEAELEALERGSPESIFLNMALAVLSMAISFSVSLATTKIESDRTFTVFVVITVFGYGAGVILGVLWLLSRRSLRSVSSQIRSRIPSEGIQETDEPA